MNDVDVELLIRRPGRRRRWLLPGLLVAVSATAAVAFVLLQPEESGVVAEPQRVEAATGQLSTTVQLTGSASAERSTTLSFESSGVVAGVAVQPGQSVRAGEALATLDDADAQRRVQTAEVQLEQAQLRLDDRLAEPEAADIASARQSVESAESQVLNAEIALARVLEPASAADIATADQSVANALGQVSSAEEALARLLEPASAADIASAEQAIASALAQVSSAEETLAALLRGPGEDEIGSAESAVTEAHAQLSSALSREDASWDALGEAFEEYCDRYGHLNDVAEGTCAAQLPFSDDEVAALRDTIEGRTTNYRRYANGLIDAHVTFIGAAAAHGSAAAGLVAAEARLADLTAPIPAGDRYQAEQAVEAARASHAAAAARLEDLRAEPTEADVFQAEQAIEAARANLAAAVARLDELHSPPADDEIEQARLSLDGARAGLVTARARLDELMAGSTANAIAQQQLSVRLAEISLEEARAAVDALTVYAPFNGVVDAVNVHPGDRVTAGLTAFSLSTSGSIVIDLAVTEADVLDLEVGQAGLASFDAVDGWAYPVRIASISRIPNAAQGVVTYDVQAHLLAGAELAAAADAIEALGGAAGLPARGAGAGLAGGPGGDAPGGGPSGGIGRGGLAGGAAGGILASLDLPEGVTLQQLAEALANGEPLPEGVRLPEGFTIPPQVLQRLAQASPGSTAEGAPGQAVAPAPRLLPAPGMTAGVTILIDLREQAVLVPVAAVRQIDDAWYVAVPASSADDPSLTFERIAVEVGSSDGVNVEITGGLEAGAAVLLGADSSGVAFSATQLQADPLPAGGFGTGRGFGGGGGAP